MTYTSNQGDWWNFKPWGKPEWTKPVEKLFDRFGTPGAIWFTGGDRCSMFHIDASRAEELALLLWQLANSVMEKTDR
jgi:hypothetical protein